MPVINTLGSLSARGFGGIGGGAAGFRGGFMMVGPSGAFASLDGINFTQLTLPTLQNPPAFYWSAIYGGGRWVVLPFGDSVGATSIDGYNWTQVDVKDFGYFRALAYGRGMFVALDYFGETSVTQFITSPDGVNWTGRTIPFYGGGFFDMVFAENRFVSIGGRVADYSTDGTNWTQVLLPFDDPLRDAYDSIAYGNGVFATVAHTDFGGAGDLAATSTDGGETWTRQTLPAYADWAGIAYGNGRFVAIGGLTAAVSTDGGVTWTEVALPAPGQVDGYGSIAFGAGLFVAPGFYSSRTNIFITSPDGVNWTERTLPTNASVLRISYSAINS